MIIIQRGAATIRCMKLREGQCTGGLGGSLFKGGWFQPIADILLRAESGLSGFGSITDQGNIKLQFRNQFSGDDTRQGR